jgi:hypothetical protein
MTPTPAAPHYQSNYPAETLCSTQELEHKSFVFLKLNTAQTQFNEVGRQRIAEHIHDK